MWGRASPGKGRACVKMMGHRGNAQRGFWPSCRGHSVPSGLGSVTSHHRGGSRNLRHTNASFSSSRSLIPATQPCQQRQLTAGQLQSTKRERIRNGENSHRSHRGHLAVGMGCGESLLSASISPHAPQDRGTGSCRCHHHSGRHSCDSSLCTKCI